MPGAGSVEWNGTQTKKSTTNALIQNERLLKIQ